MSKLRVLAWGDAPLANTGFGTVSKHVLSALHATGKYEIDHLAINYTGDFIDKNLVPWQLVPAKLLDAKDPHGIKMFQKAMLQKDYDIIWIINDLFVTNEVKDFIPKIRAHYKSKKIKPPVFIYYYPVDCSVPNGSTGLLDQVDIPVCYTVHGMEETLKTRPQLANKLRKISHGTDLSTFKPLSESEIKQLKKDFLGVSPDTTVVVQVNRNSTRKQIQYSMLAFKEFQKLVPNSVYYIHSQVADQGGNLLHAIHSLDLSPQKDIILPLGFRVENAPPPSELNKIYNMGDIFLSTHLGEGWGLSLSEAMSCGVPVVTGRNTCMTELFGEDSKRGYLYPCEDWAYIDGSGYRKKGLIPDIVTQMMQAYNDGPKQNNPKVKQGLEFVKSITWDKVGKQWIELFELATSVRNNSKLQIGDIL